MDPEYAYFPVTTLPAPYDIVWCRFPLDEIPGPGPKSRPAIVKQALQDEEGNPWVNVMYGTTKLRMRENPFDFYVSNMTEMDHAGLFHATRFELKRCKIVPWAEEYFAKLRGYPSPVIGRLSPHSIRMLQVAVAHAQHNGHL